MKKILNKGFTLIELLVVITLIAILAVAILAAINPVEQRNKALDTGYQSAATQTVSAMERFYTTYGYWPHEAAVDATTGVVSELASPGTPALTDIAKLVAVGEIKNDKIQDDLTDANAVISVDTSDTAHVCFVPVSDAMRGKAVFSSTAAAWTTGTRYYCVPDGN